MERTDNPLYSFVDRDMLVRHFGHGVGHLKYERQQEVDAERVPGGNDNHGDLNDDTSECEESEEEIHDGSDDTESEGEPVVNTDDSSDGDSEEDSESYSICNSDDDGGYASF